MRCPLETNKQIELSDNDLEQITSGKAILLIKELTGAPSTILGKAFVIAK